mmetsp:Transcript_35262/g.92541  ORF Transcript_35262/g.92541 Transcript_35262/m.92541 type:complete len:214 (+) Transcript_35262:476-1117(+)
MRAATGPSRGWWHPRHTTPPPPSAQLPRKLATVLLPCPRSPLAAFVPSAVCLCHNGRHPHRLQTMARHCLDHLCFTPRVHARHVSSPRSLAYGARASPLCTGASLDGRPGRARARDPLLEPRPHSGKSISPCMMRDDSTEKPSIEGSAVFFPLPFLLFAGAKPPSSAAAPSLPFRPAVCQSRDSPVPRAARLRRTNSLPKLRTAADSPRYMLR